MRSGGLGDSTSSGKSRASLPHLVLLPGMDGTGQLFGPLRAALPKRFALHTVSFPPDEKLDYQQLIPFVQKAVPASEPYVVIAESFSGALAIEHAASRPANLKAIVLSASFVANPLPRSLKWLRFLVRESLFRIRPKDAFIRYALLGKNSPPRLVEMVAAATQSVQPEVLAHRLRLILDLDVRDLAQSVEVPVLYIAGRHDRLIGQRGLDQVSALVPHLSTTTLAGPHLLLQRIPHEAAQEIVQFLDRELAV